MKHLFKSENLPKKKKNLIVPFSKSPPKPAKIIKKRCVLILNSGSRSTDKCLRSVAEVTGRGSDNK